MKELSGKLTVEIDPAKLQELCNKHIPGYSPERFHLVAIRLFRAPDVLLTIYAEDRFNNGSQLHTGKFPVKKFKKPIHDAAELFELFNAYNFTISDGDYRLEDMEVTNR